MRALHTQQAARKKKFKSCLPEPALHGRRRTYPPSTPPPLTSSTPGRALLSPRLLRRILVHEDVEVLVWVFGAKRRSSVPRAGWALARPLRRRPGLTLRSGRALRPQRVTVSQWGGCASGGGGTRSAGRLAERVQAARRARERGARKRGSQRASAHMARTHNIARARAECACARAECA